MSAAAAPVESGREREAEGESQTDGDDAAKAEALKNKANEFFKCERNCSGLGVKAETPLYTCSTSYQPLWPVTFQF